VVNALFQIAAAGLSLLQRFAVAAFITASEFGIWGIVLLILITLSWLKEIGISDKYLQQDEPDQELAFQKAFTLELAYTGIFCLLVLWSLPLFGLVYDNTDIVVPAAVLTLSLIGGALQAPIWVYFRRMQFVRQRTLALINPILHGDNDPPRRRGSRLLEHRRRHRRRELRGRDRRDRLLAVPARTAL